MPTASWVIESKSPGGKSRNTAKGAKNSVPKKVPLTKIWTLEVKTSLGAVTTRMLRSSAATPSVSNAMVAPSSMAKSSMSATASTRIHCSTSGTGGVTGKRRSSTSASKGVVEPLPSSLNCSTSIIMPRSMFWLMMGNVALQFPRDAGNRADMNTAGHTSNSVSVPVSTNVHTSPTHVALNSGHVDVIPPKMMPISVEQSYVS
mmetsp:Transcript_8904/g.36781  ORF Transcript_8904/g.36781 Transcript_8904/m.36781 type:complete len:203 (-) Transcript_8904:1774-2382(-)